MFKTVHTNWWLKVETEKIFVKIFLTKWSVYLHLEREHREEKKISQFQKSSDETDNEGCLRTLVKVTNDGMFYSNSYLLSQMT